MARKSKITSISVSHLARFAADEEGFEAFLNATPNPHAIKQGNDFHDNGAYQAVKIKLLVLILIGGAGAVLFLLLNSDIL